MNTNKVALVNLITSKAQMLASKYKNQQLYQDLVSEATLVGLELMEQGVDDEKKIVGAMRRRLYDFMNFGQLPVYVPASGYSREGLLNMGGDESTPDIMWPLLQALMAAGGVHSLDDTNLPAISDHVKDYEDYEYLQHLMFIMEECLDSREFDMVVAVYLNGADQQEVADEYGITQQRVSKVMDLAFKKVRKALDVPEL